MKVPPLKLAFVSAMLLQESIDSLSADQKTYLHKLKYTAKAFQDQCKPLIEKQYRVLSDEQQKGLNELWTIIEDLVTLVTESTVQDFASMRMLLDALKGIERKDLEILISLINLYREGKVSAVEDTLFLTIESRTNYVTSDISQELRESKISISNSET